MNSTAMLYRAPVAAKLAGVSYRQIYSWTESGLVEAVVETLGSGDPRGYDYLSVLRLRVIRALLDGGLSLQIVRKVMGSVTPTDLAGGNVLLVMNDGRAGVYSEEGAVERAREVVMASFLTLAPLREELLERSRVSEGVA